tara:strand:+ start:781 stop:1395 length:615 start_codon:yes stop_codon:yes gene_type:complete
VRIALDKKAEDCMKDNSWLQLRTPLTQYKKNDDLQWVLDNGCYSKFKPEVWKKMVNDAINDFGCIWFTMPDVVGNHEQTLVNFYNWKKYFEKTYPHMHKINKYAFVLQDGCKIEDIPWDHIRCVFLGGTDRFKYSREAWLILEEAHKKYKWVHIGRVNTKGRIVYFYDIAHSIDGTGLSKYDHMYKEAVRAIDNLYGTIQEKIV